MIEIYRGLSIIHADTKEEAEKRMIPSMAVIVENIEHDIWAGFSSEDDYFEYKKDRKEYIREAVSIFSKAKELSVQP